MSAYGSAAPADVVDHIEKEAFTATKVAMLHVLDENDLDLDKARLSPFWGRAGYWNACFAGAAVTLPSPERGQCDRGVGGAGILLLCW